MIKQVYSKDEISQFPYFNGLSELQRYVNGVLKKGCDFANIVVMDGFLYSQESYDFNGKCIDYVSVDANAGFEILTENRYETGCEGLRVSFYKGLGCFRNDISYASASL